MKTIAVLGTGIVGQTIATRLVELGFTVTMGSRDVEAALASTKANMGGTTLAAWHNNNKQVTLAAFSTAAAAGEIIINATSGQATLAALELAGAANLAGKTLIDIANPLDFSQGFPPSLSVCNTDSLGEQIQKAFPEVKVVKTLNTMTCYVMVHPESVPGDHSVFLSGNSEAAKAEAAELLKALGWKQHNIYDLGDITSARGTEQLLPIWVRLYGTLKTGMFNFNIVKA
ncbi:MAG: NAD(P)-binding domain-containing protein [Ignavibacteriales bacterium]|nr:NAD(P)-binding domain-containing protein [Ignavibacteriales bacterium]